MKIELHKITVRELVEGYVDDAESGVRGFDGKLDILSILVKSGLCPSKSDARRNVQQGGVTVDDVKISDIAASYDADTLRNGIIVRRGKKSFSKVVLK